MFTIIDQQDRVSSPLKYEVVTAPAVEPVSYQELVDFMRLPSTADRSIVNGLEIAARNYVEQATRQTLVTTTFDLWLDVFPFRIILPARPVQSVTYIKYTDQTGVVQTLDPSRYNVDLKGPRPCITPPLGTIFPIPKVQYPNAVQVRFVAGLSGISGAELGAAGVPDGLKLLIKQWVSMNYVDGANVLLGRSPQQIPDTFKYLLSINSLPEV